MLGIFDRQEGDPFPVELVMFLIIPRFPASSWPPLADVRYRTVLPDRRSASSPHLWCNGLRQQLISWPNCIAVLVVYAPDILYPVRDTVKLRSSRPLGDPSKANTEKQRSRQKYSMDSIGLHNQDGVEIATYDSHIRRRH